MNEMESRSYKANTQQRILLSTLQHTHWCINCIYSDAVQWAVDGTLVFPVILQKHGTGLLNTSKITTGHQQYNDALISKEMTLDSNSPLNYL